MRVGAFVFGKNNMNHLAYCKKKEYNLLCVLLRKNKKITLRIVEVIWKLREKYI